MFSHDEFDKKFNRTSKKLDIFAIVNTVVGIAITGSIVWVAWHFISKVW